jgi:hypothetical protein
MPSDERDVDTSITLMMRLRQAPADLEAWDEFVRRYRPMIRDWCLIQKPADAVWFVERGGEPTSSTSMAAS